MAKTKIGVAGCGVMGSFHILKALDSSAINLVGVFDQDETRSKQIAEKFGINSYPNLSALLSDISALIVASPTATHYEIAKQAIEAGKHLLVEKPLCGSSSQAVEMADLADQKNLILSVGMIERFNPAFLAALPFLKKEKILGIEFKRMSPYPSRISDVSVIWDVMIHDLDILLSLDRSGVDSVKAKGKKINSDRFDEVGSKIYMKNGLIATIYCSRCKNEKIRLMVATTDKSIYEIDFLNKKLFKRDFDALSAKMGLPVQLEDQIFLEHKDLLSAINNDRTPKCSGRDAIQAIILAEEVESKCFGR